MNKGMSLPSMRVSIPPLSMLPPPPLALRFCPVGPPGLEQVEAADACVVSIPGRYCMTHVLVGPDCLALVDVGSMADLPLIEAVLAWLDKPLVWVLASHLHFDHCLGLDRIAVQHGARVGLHPLAHATAKGGAKLRGPGLWSLRLFWHTWLWQGAPLLAPEDRAEGLRFGFPWSANRFSAELAPALKEGYALEGLPGWRVLHTPGHADEAICLLHEEAGFLVTGDTLRNFRGGEWNPLLTDGRAYRRSKARLESLEIQAVFPGHGPNILGGSLWRRLRPLPVLAGRV